MKKTIILSVLFIVMMAAAVVGYQILTSDYSAETIKVPVAGTVPAEDFTVQDWEGGQVSLSDYYGKPIVVNFWATWCGPCKSELPAFDNAYAAYQDEITFLMVNMTDGYSETVAGTKQFIEENGYSFPVYFDTSYEAYQAYGVTAIPMMLFIDADGKLIASQLGAMSESTFTGYLQEYYGVKYTRKQ